jgi:tetraacyldisaccharide 4'-kinase
VHLIERIWTGSAPAEKLGRSALSPFALLFRGGVALRGALYDRGILRAQKAPIPVISIGNLTVGGTGKTPVAAWLVSRLAANGRSPAVVLRGYGGDETIVHKVLNPSVQVIEARDRVSGIRIAADNGADVAILDDAFQHRRTARDVDIVLVSADGWTGEQRLLPAGPYREPMNALRRASAVLITRRIASDSTVGEIERLVRQTASAALIGVAKLELGDLVQYSQPQNRQPLRDLQGKAVLAVAGIGNPRAFFGQLRMSGAQVVTMEFPDHHAYTANDVRDIAANAARTDYAVCTLKDAVKLGPQWPPAARPLWYVSLSVNVERGGAAIDEILTRLDSTRDS